MQAGTGVCALKRGGGGLEIPYKLYILYITMYIHHNWKSYKNLYNYWTSRTTSKEIGKLLDSKMENTLPGWFELRT